MTTPTDWRALCAELLECAKELDDLMQSVILGDYMPDSLTLQPIRIALDCARTALAQPEPEGPTDEELLMTYQHAVSSQVESIIQSTGTYAGMDDLAAATLAGLHAVLQRCGRPVTTTETP